MPALVAVPAEVGATGALAQVVDLLPRVLADVADVEIAGRAVEGEAPRVAQAVGDELPPRLRGVDVQPHDLRERPREALAVVLRVAAAAAVAVTPVEALVRAELQLAAVVVRREVLDEEQLLRRRRDRGRCRSSGTARRACRRSSRCSRRRSGGSARSPARTRPTAAPALPRFAPASGCRGTACSGCGRSSSTRIRPACSTT